MFYDAVLLVYDGVLLVSCASVLFMHYDGILFIYHNSVLSVYYECPICVLRWSLFAYYDAVL
jgi:hypothetical protein